MIVVAGLAGYQNASKTETVGLAIACCQKEGNKTIGLGLFFWFKK